MRLVIREFERAYLLLALEATHGRKAKAADILGVSRKALWKKLVGHGINARRSGKVVARRGRHVASSGAPPTNDSARASSST